MPSPPPAPTPKKPPLEETLREKLVEVRHQEQEERTKELAKKLNLPYIDLTILPVETEALALIDETTARQGKIAVIQKLDSSLKIAAQDPRNPATKKVLTDFQGRGLQCAVFIASAASLEKAFQRYEDLAKKAAEITGQVEITEEFLGRFQQEIKTLQDIKKKVERIPQEQTAYILEVMIAGALQNDASDLHLEGKEQGALLRYRIDGILHDVVFLSPKTYGLILSRLKLQAGMVLNVRDRAQDGRFTIRLQKFDMEVRVSVIPGPYGENIVMRVLNPKTISLSIKDLGFREDAYQFIKKEIARPNGMIITTGPTGSGKTTALYAFLKEVADPEIKIITLEDPIEYHLADVTQTQVEAERGYTFASGLRAILRQDPDVILVGEIRDAETAEIAVQAALTGHVVFSTLHTNDAAGAIPRFIDIGANPTTLSAALIDILAQRLLRRICLACKKEHEPTSEEKEKIKKALTDIPSTVAVPDIAKGFKLSRGGGCAKCNNTGYKGRIGVFEIIHIDTDLEKLITKSPSHAEVLELIKQKGFISMYQDGIIKVLRGSTTLEELESTVGTQ